MPRDQLIGHFFRGLERLVPLAKKAGTRLLVENMPFAFIPGIADLMAALDQFGNDDIGVVYDVANGYFIKEDIGKGLKTAKPRLALVHLSDTNQQVYRHDPSGSVPCRLKSFRPCLPRSAIAIARAGDHRCQCRHADRGQCTPPGEAGFKASAG